ncbi:P-loop containing nucleoside triphosphate hydrolase protein [Mycena pura]|uniref:DNA 3'-5' helicase n=1 Tax=Mycena pura TaxID=153505 RepID=A0AAD6VIZ0_9AGAR|nr:P-loop containing nucleoside triphosphate hydrolase protein [Mycena pura]
MVREGTMSIVVSPTNFLQRDMVASMLKKNISSIAINSDTLTAAALVLPKRELWAEAKTGMHRLVFIGPETSKSADYQGFIANQNVRSRLAQFTVDEVHAADEWGVEFRTDFQDIPTMRARLPDHTTYVALSASIEPGRQYDNCVKLMGFRPGFHLEKQDCERYNVALIVRRIKYTSSGLEFRDLDWLVSLDLTKASDALKYLLFVQSIEQGHRIVNYLRSLLLPHLQKYARRLIRHHHSLACPECKNEGMEALYKCGEDRDCLIHASTDVLTVGVDIPGLAGVIIYGPITSASALIQRAGRPVRERGTKGFAWIYVTKADMVDAMAYIDSEAGKQDKRVLDVKDLGSHVRTVAAPAENEPTVVVNPRTCTSLLLIFAAHARDRCISRQINIIYANPGVDKDCGRCSSCVGDVVPEPRKPLAAAEQQPKDYVVDLEAEKVPGYLKPQAKDLKAVADKLENSARIIRWSQPRRSDTLLISARIFLPPNIVSSITTNFLLITSEDDFKARIRQWKYAEEYGAALWSVVKVLVDNLRSELETRHKLALEKQRDARLHKWTVAAGLDHIKSVRVHVAATIAPAIPSAATDIRTEVDFLGEPSSKKSPAKNLKHKFEETLKPTKSIKQRKKTVRLLCMYLYQISCFVPTSRTKKMLCLPTALRRVPQNLGKQIKPNPD